jgi:glycosyltransferase involved in cell wall biosynthesis
LRCLLVHNRYQHAGGEDEVFRAEAELLRAAGHEVSEYRRANDEIALNGFVSRARLAATTIWSRESHRALAALLERERPDVAHFHNTLPLVSPSAYYACRDAGVPVVQTLHNYRLLCPAATLFREGQVCQECLEHSLARSVRYGCYRGSRAATAAVAAMLGAHRALGTWRDKVDVYIALTEFSRRKFTEAGLPAEKIVVKPNFVHPDPRSLFTVQAGRRTGAGEHALFVGRFWPEKGVRTMLEAWKRLRNIPLDIIGDGPEHAEMEALAADADGVRFRGRLPREQTIAAIRQARFLVFPSEWYECFPMTILEAFAGSVPVIASRLGGMEEIVADGRTGLHFTAGDAEDLAAKVDWAWTHPREMAEMGRAARAEYEAKYTAARNYEMLMQIYERAVAAVAGR